MTITHIEAHFQGGSPHFRPISVSIRAELGGDDVDAAYESLETVAKRTIARQTVRLLKEYIKAQGWPGGEMPKELYDELRTWEQMAEVGNVMVS